MTHEPSDKSFLYAPSPQPSSNSVEAVKVWCEREFYRIATAMLEGRSQWLHLDVMKELPPRPHHGYMGYFAAGVAGATEGMYEYRSDDAWHKL